MIGAIDIANMFIDKVKQNTDDKVRLMEGASIVYNACFDVFEQSYRNHHDLNAAKNITVGVASSVGVHLKKHYGRDIVDSKRLSEVVEQKLTIVIQNITKPFKKVIPDTPK